MDAAREEVDDRVVEKLPGRRSEMWMAVLSAASLMLGLVIGMALLAWHDTVGGTYLFTPGRALWVIFVTITTTLATLALHEALHGLGMVAFGARPSFGAGIMAPGMPYLYTTSEGHLFTRPQYILVAALPNVLINAVLAALIVLGPHETWWVVPFAMHLSGGVGDAWLCWSALAEPPRTLIEDLRGGIRVHRPR